MKNTLFIFVFLLLVIACAKKPNYSKVPEISFKSFQYISSDSALLSINFSDGDGDIGSTGSSQGNFFIVYRFWDSNLKKYYVYTDTTFFQDSIDVRTFQSPSDAYKNKPISGEISLIMGAYRPNNSIKKLKFDIFIKDNSGNKSNTIQTPDLYVP